VSAKFPDSRVRIRKWSSDTALVPFKLRFGLTALTGVVFLLQIASFLSFDFETYRILVFFVFLLLCLDLSFPNSGETMPIKARPVN